MPIRDRINAHEYPYNLAYEILVCKSDPLPEDIAGSLEYVLYTALSERDRNILVMHWRDKMTLEKIGEAIGGMSKQTVHDIEQKALRRIRSKWSRYIVYGVSGIIDAEMYRTEKIKEHEKKKEKQYEDDPLSIPLYELDFSVRTYNALHRAGIETLSDIKDKMEETGCTKIRNLGKKSIIDILRKFDNLGVSIYNIAEVFSKWNITRQEVRG